MKPLMVAPGWRNALLVLAGVWLVILGIYRDTAEIMVALWNRSETYAHAWVVPPIALWLVWRLRAQALAIAPRPAPVVLLLAAGAGLLWLLGELVAVNTATQLAMVALLVLAVPALLGLEVAWTLIFPLGFLFFAVPAGDFLTPYLMQWTADITVWALRLSGIPVYREGLQFVIPSGNWSVVEACSGMRYLLASMMVGTLFAYLNYNSARRRVIFVLISLVVPILANWLRAYMIVMLGHYSGNTLAVGADHLVYGWVLFGIIIMTLYWIGARWAEPIIEAPARPVSAARWPLGGGLVVAGLALAIALLPMQALQRIDASTSQVPVVLNLPASLPDLAPAKGGTAATQTGQTPMWTAEPEVLPAWSPGFQNPSEERRGEYQAQDGARVGVYLGYYRQQGDKRKLISSNNHVLRTDSREWNALAGPSRMVVLPQGEAKLIETRLVQPEYARSNGGGERRSLRIWRTYWINGHLVAGDVQGKLWGAWSRLAGHGDDAAVILVYTDDTDPEAAQVRLGRFLATGLPALMASLDAARPQGTAP